MLGKLLRFIERLVNPKVGMAKEGIACKYCGGRGYTSFKERLDIDCLKCKGLGCQSCELTGKQMYVTEILCEVCDSHLVRRSLL